MLPHYLANVISSPFGIYLEENADENVTRFDFWTHTQF